MTRFIKPDLRAGPIGRFLRRTTRIGNIVRTYLGLPVSGGPDVQRSRNFALCGPGTPVEVTGEDDVVPGALARWRQRRSRTHAVVVDRCRSLRPHRFHFPCLTPAATGSDRRTRRCGFPTENSLYRLPPSIYSYVRQIESGKNLWGWTQKITRVPALDTGHFEGFK